MPTVPVYISQREPPRIPDVPTPRGVHGMFGEGLAQGVQQAASDFAQIAQASQQRRDEAAAAEAWTAASMKITEYMHGAPDAAGNMQPGALATLGKESAGMSKKFGELSRTWEEEIGSKLDPRVRQHFKQRYGMAVVNAIGQLSAHEAGQLRASEIAALEASATTSANNALANFANDQAFNGTLSAGVTDLALALKHAGKPAEEITRITGEFVSKTRADRSKRFADSGQYDRARALAVDESIAATVRDDLRLYADSREKHDKATAHALQEAQRLESARQAKAIRDAANDAAGRIALDTMRNASDGNRVSATEAIARLNGPEFANADPDVILSKVKAIRDIEAMKVAPADTFPSASDAGVFHDLYRLSIERPVEAADKLTAAAQLRLLSKGDFDALNDRVTKQMNDREKAAMQVIFTEWDELRKNVAAKDKDGKPKAEYFYQTGGKPSPSRENIMLGERTPEYWDKEEALTPKQLNDFHSHIKLYLSANPNASVDKVEKYARELLYPSKVDAIRLSLPDRMANESMRMKSVLNAADDRRQERVAFFVDAYASQMSRSTLEARMRLTEVPEDDRVITSLPAGASPVINQQIVKP